MNLPRAWRVQAMGADLIVRAMSRAKAKYLVFRAAREAGYPITFPMIRARRAPEFDFQVRNEARRDIEEAIS